MTQQPLTTTKIAELEQFNNNLTKQIVNNYNQIRTTHDKKLKVQLINQYNQLTRIQLKLIHTITQLTLMFRDNTDYNKTLKTLTTTDRKYFKFNYDSHGQPIKQ